MIYNYIVIEGNIGAGKTSLASQMAEEHNARLILEQFEDNSFLPKFYKDPEKYAFPLEMSFLAARYQQLKTQLSKQDLFKTFTIADYFIDKSLIIARNNLQGDEYTLYARLFQIISSTLPRPDLLVYLYLDTDGLLSNIDKRGRDYEKKIKAEYLDDVQKVYLNYFRQLEGIRILIIDINGLDFVSHAKDYHKLSGLILQDYSPGIHRLSL